MAVGSGLQMQELKRRSKRRFPAKRNSRSTITIPIRSLPSSITRCGFGTKRRRLNPNSALLAVGGEAWRLSFKRRDLTSLGCRLGRLSRNLKIRAWNDVVLSLYFYRWFLSRCLDFTRRSPAGADHAIRRIPMVVLAVDAVQLQTLRKPSTWMTIGLRMI